MSRAHASPKWWDEQPLGQMTDKALAKKLNCSMTTIFLQRKKRNIPHYRRVDHIDWVNQPWGLYTVSQIAKNLGCSVSHVSNKRKMYTDLPLPSAPIDWDDQPLGKLPDSELATRLDCATATVGIHRRARRIPAMQLAKEPKYIKLLTKAMDYEKAGIPAIAGEERKTLHALITRLRGDLA